MILVYLNNYIWSPQPKTSSKQTKFSSLSWLLNWQNRFSRLLWYTSFFRQNLFVYETSPMIVGEEFVLRNAEGRYLLLSNGRSKLNFWRGCVICTSYFSFSLIIFLLLNRFQQTRMVSKLSAFQTICQTSPYIEEFLYYGRFYSDNLLIFAWR